MRAALRSSLVVALATVLGCADGPTSVRVDIDTADAQPVHALAATVTLPGRSPVTQLLPADGSSPPLPASVLVLLPDEAVVVTVALSALDLAGQPRSAVGAIAAMPHRQVELHLTLASGTPPDLGGGDAAPGDAGTDGATGDQGAGVLAFDDFHRPDQVDWGTATDGQVWQGDPNGNTLFAISNHEGVIGPSPASSYVGWLGPVAADVDVTVLASISSVVVGNLGVCARLQDSNNFYEAQLSSGDLRLELRQAGGTTTLAQISPSFSLTSNVVYAIRLQVQGNTLRAKAWPAAQAEPAGFPVTASDGTYGSGFVGLRAVPGTAAEHVDLFTAIALP